jgi:hypothetical protein
MRVMQLLRLLQSEDLARLAQSPTEVLTRVMWLLRREDLARLEQFPTEVLHLAS